MLKRYSVRNLNQDAIDMLAEIRHEERRDTGAILEDCILAYWQEVFEEAQETESHAAEAA